MKIAIIGSAFRKDDSDKLNLGLYNKMVNQAKLFCLRYKPDELISGGAAGADFVAVQLFNEKLIKALTLYLPCEFDKVRHFYEDSGDMDYILNPGGTLNYLHKKFSYKVQFNSLLEIEKALDNGTKSIVVPGFKERNTEIAKNADMVLAMTFGQKQLPKRGGTSDTVEKFFDFKDGNYNKYYHYNLNDLKLYNFQGKIV